MASKMHETYLYIITVCYNDSNNLKRTIESVRNFKKLNYKFCIIDGGSTDDTLNIIKENSDIIEYYISEKDYGIYDAMNKALNIPTISEHDYLYWLNAGDELLNTELSIIEYIENYKCYFFSVISKKNVSDKGRLINPILKKKKCIYSFFPGSIFMHQGFIIEVELFKKYKYDISIVLQAELLLMSNCMFNEYYGYSNIPIANYYTDGISNTKYKDTYLSFCKVIKKMNFILLNHFLTYPLFHIKWWIKILIKYLVSVPK